MELSELQSFQTRSRMPEDEEEKADCTMARPVCKHSAACLELRNQRPQTLRRRLGTVGRSCALLKLRNDVMRTAKKTRGEES